MATILNFEAAQCARLPGYSDTLNAVRACDELRRHLMGEAPMTAPAIAEALATVRRLAISNAETT